MVAERNGSKHFGGAETSAWEALSEIENCDRKAGEEAQGAVTLVVDLVMAFEKVQLVVAWHWTVYKKLPLRIKGYFA